MIRFPGKSLFHKLKVLAAAIALIVATPAIGFAATLEQMAGQMIIVGFHGNSVDDKSVAALRGEIAAGTLGGVMYLKPNVASLAAVKAMNKAFKAANPALPPFITLDQEGGFVERLTKDVGFAELPTAAAVAAADSPAQARQLYAKMAAAVADLGFTVNFGPVVDLNVNPSNPVIGKYGRSFSKDPAVVVEYAKAFIAAHRKVGLLTALKHFPGHGSSTTDSHEGFVDITRTWSKVELQPYVDLIAAKMVDLIMVGHLYDENIEGAGKLQLPASLSPEWINGQLRGKLGFTGVVISDDLEMGAIRKQFTTKDTVIRAVNAGVDVLLFSNTAAYDAGEADIIRGYLVAAAKADPAFEKRIEASYARIAALKAGIAK